MSTKSSAGSRAVGNHHFQVFTAMCNSKSVDFTDSVQARKGSLCKALEHYKAALSCAENMEDRASASKNIGTVHKHLGEQDGRAVTKLFCWKDAVRAFSEALEYAGSPHGNKSKDWVEGVADTMEQVCEKVKDHVDRMNDSKDQVKHVMELAKCIDKISVHPRQALIYLLAKFHEAELRVNAGLKMLEDSQFQAGLNGLRDARNTLEATNLGLAHLQGEDKHEEALEDIEEKINKLEMKLEANARLAESLVLLLGAEDKIKQVTEKNGAVEVDTVWDCYDMVRRGTGLASQGEELALLPKAAVDLRTSLTGLSGLGSDGEGGIASKAVVDQLADMLEEIVHIKEEVIDKLEPSIVFKPTEKKVETGKASFAGDTGPSYSRYPDTGAGATQDYNEDSDADSMPDLE